VAFPAVGPTNVGTRKRAGFDGEAILRFSEIPVRGFPMLYFENMDDQNIVMNRNKSPHTPADPDRINRVFGI
jgi:hypothetical protein